MRPFYLDQHSIIRFPKREIYNSAPHEIWFKDEGIPTVGIIRGYFYDDYISVFINDHDIPPIHSAVIMDWFNTYNNLNYVELGANKVGEQHVPKLVVFRGDSVRFQARKQEETDTEAVKENLIDESSKINKKEKVGFKNNEDNSNK